MSQKTSHLNVDSSQVAAFGVASPSKPAVRGAPQAPAPKAQSAPQARNGAAGAAPLVPNAKSPARALARTAERFELQSVARSILPKSRTAKCMRIRAFDQDIAVWKSKEFQTASYGGLQTCGSVWTCPVCAAKIAERRRLELVHAVDTHTLNGGTVWMMTLTSPHGRGDVLKDLLAAQGAALSAFYADKAVKKVLAEMGMIGKIRALEVTHGRKRMESNHGWHPHFHILKFCSHGASDEQVLDWENRLYERWAAYCVAKGLGRPSREHGIQIQDGKKAAVYVSKWGVEDEVKKVPKKESTWGISDEMTKAHIKKSRGGETPFDLLRAAAADSEDLQARVLFEEYAKHFKGKRQLSWSRGLKKKFAVVEASDKELAEAKEDRADCMGLIAPFQWKDVLFVRGRTTVLELATLGSWVYVETFLNLISGIHLEGERSPETMEIAAEARQLLLENIGIRDAQAALSLSAESPPHGGEEASSDLEFPSG